MEERFEKYEKNEKTEKSKSDKEAGKDKKDKKDRKDNPEQTAIVIQKVPNAVRRGTETRSLMEAQSAWASLPLDVAMAAAVEGQVEKKADEKQQGASPKERIAVLGQAASRLRAEIETKLSERDAGTKATSRSESPPPTMEPAPSTPQNGTEVSAARLLKEHGEASPGSQPMPQ